MRWTLQTSKVVGSGPKVRVEIAASASEEYLLLISVHLQRRECRMCNVLRRESVTGRNYQDASSRLHIDRRSGRVTGPAGRRNYWDSLRSAVVSLSCRAVGRVSTGSNVGESQINYCTPHRQHCSRTCSLRFFQISKNVTFYIFWNDVSLAKV